MQDRRKKGKEGEEEGRREARNKVCKWGRRVIVGEVQRERKKTFMAPLKL